MMMMPGAVAVMVVADMNAHAHRADVNTDLVGKCSRRHQRQRARNQSSFENRFHCPVPDKEVDDAPVG
jgi:hypothetical protein